ncbi:DNA-binding transcriptional regulator HcaR [Crenobacter sp. SG2303]|uniref:DNA-binding transcriptional regulator HcaR n=1 Tax=Crenobacter oryzisoli TaxID=3056844 RepID=A0ABT7XRI6_9NEIS|nr:DNA-binding transcriptional regulator HcaR [Crenobacter sp. SG2303]MDN0076411.1 DNA-binding transcriptional regulator HcaR [Crenobacter sp. SG2303]
MELRHLRYFVMVAEELNFTRAAERLHTAQPSLSQQIRDLESYIGTPLLERTKRKVELTAAGKVFLTEARLTLAQAERAVAQARRVAQQRRDTITIGFIPAAEVKIFPAILPSLRLRFPNLTVNLKSLPTLQQQEALLEGEIDLAFMRPPLEHPGLASQVVMTEPIVVVLPASHPLAAKTRITIEELVHEPYIRTDPRFAGSAFDVVDRYCHDHGVSLHPVQDASNVLLNLNLVSGGLGFGLLPAYVQQLMNRSVCSRPLADGGPTLDLLMAWRKGEQSEAVDVFISLLKEALPEKVTD